MFQGALPIVSHPAYEAALPEGHPFPMRKYGRLAALLRERGFAPQGFVQPEPASADLLALAHDPSYVDQVLACAVPREVERRIGLSVDKGVVRRACTSAGGTLLAARLALRHGLAGSTVGGSHHGQRATGAGFCVFNDVAIAAKALKREGAIRRALVVDLDVHQGDGTADCLSDDPTCSASRFMPRRTTPCAGSPGISMSACLMGSRTTPTSTSCARTRRAFSTGLRPISCSTTRGSTRIATTSSDGSD